MTIPAPWKKIVHQFFYSELRDAILISCVVRLFTDSSCLETSQVTEGGPGHVLKRTWFVTTCLVVEDGIIR